ncbi:hypothetical protein CC79DRAFT_1365784 [Sarocladium strictum]
MASLLRAFTRTTALASIPRFSSLIRATPTVTTMQTAQPAMGTSLARAAEQTRGMKVHSAVKKRCEHCKVVRRKSGKRHNGYLYIICKANPRHKQRQG